MLAHLKNYLTAACASISRKSYPRGRDPLQLQPLALAGALPICARRPTAAERAIRPLALGRKNYLFAGSDAGGRRAAILETLIQTATLNGLDPEAYLRAVLARSADHQLAGEAEPSAVPLQAPRSDSRRDRFRPASN